jgi:hypothetical protein
LYDVGCVFARAAVVVRLIGGSGRGSVNNWCCRKWLCCTVCVFSGCWKHRGRGQWVGVHIGLGVPVGCKSGDNPRLDLSLTRVFLLSPTQISRFPWSKEPNQFNDAASCYNELLPSKTVLSVLAHPAFQPLRVSDITEAILRQQRMMTTSSLSLRGHGSVPLALGVCQHREVCGVAVHDC